MIMMTSSKQQLQYFNPITPLSMSNFTDSLVGRLQQIHTASRPIILVCIGSDRATGDSLGPFVGHELLHPFPTDRRQSFADKRNSKTRFSCKKGQYPRTVPKSSRSLWNLLTTYSAFPKKYYVYGSLHSPVHAVNLKATLQDIYRSFDDPYIIAIDAALGAKEHIGTVTLGDGTLFPGIGVSKQLPAVGDIHITGIVNTINCQNRNLILQTTHLSTVVSLATFISKGIRQALLQQDLTCPCDPLVRDTK